MYCLYIYIYIGYITYLFDNICYRVFVINIYIYIYIYIYLYKPTLYIVSYISEVYNLLPLL